jgi:hypothetical protein
MGDTVAAFRAVFRRKTGFPAPASRRRRLLDEVALLAQPAASAQTAVSHRAARTLKQFPQCLGIFGAKRKTRVWTAGIHIYFDRRRKPLSAFDHCVRSPAAAAPTRATTAHVATAQTASHGVITPFGLALMSDANKSYSVS